VLCGAPAPPTRSEVEGSGTIRSRLPIGGASRSVQTRSPYSTANASSSRRDSSHDGRAPGRRSRAQTSSFNQVTSSEPPIGLKLDHQSPGRRVFEAPTTPLVGKANKRQRDPGECRTTDQPITGEVRRKRSESKFRVRRQAARARFFPTSSGSLPGGAREPQGQRLVRFSGLLDGVPGT